jgi:tetratricopeptide (TPR) repeat protein
MRLHRLLALALILEIFLSGCVYYNTFYHARKAFNDAESKRKAAGPKASGKSFAGQYTRAAEKSQKVLDNYPNSSWYDDALYLNAVSSYYLEDYGKAERRFRELTANYPESPYIKEGKLYLAKTKLKMGEEAEAMTLFEKLFAESRDRRIKVEAALALGQYYFDKKNYAAAEPYFESLVDSLGNHREKIISQMYIADGYYARFNYRAALDNYLKVLEYNPEKEERYRANLRIGECSIYLYQIQDGMEYLSKLASDPLFFDSLPSIKLMMAFGYEMDGNIALAEEIYKQVSLEDQGTHGAVALYNLGLIYQYDYENYKKAKEYYDKAKSAGSSSGVYHEALQRSTDIGKLEEYSKMQTLDTGATQEEIDNAANNQYLLAELYLTQLDKPDSALQEFQFVYDKFPTSYLAPKALIARAITLRDNYDDTLAFDTTLRKVLREYPRSDFAPEAIALLGLSGTIADSGYAALYYHKAERFLFEKQNLDSARFYFRLVADSFPQSKLNNQAKFALLWVTENYASPDDSSLYYAYANFADSFATTEYGKEASRKLIVKPKLSRDVEDSLLAANTAGKKDTGNVAGLQDTTGQKPMSPEERYHTDPDGNRIFLFPNEPERQDRAFVFPTAAYTADFREDFYLYFQIKLDPFGDVQEAKLMNPTSSEELNLEATETLLSSHFSMVGVPPELYDAWHVYKFKVVLPTSMK